MDRKREQPSASPDFAPEGPGGEGAGKAFGFAGFRLEADGSLFRGEALLHLPPRELAALRLLLANAGQIVTPLQLKQALWGDVHVTADSIPRCLSSLRARLQPEDCIQTVYKRGYRLLADVRPSQANPATILPRLAIPPFSTGTGVPEHLGTAIAEETIARLSNVPRPLASMLARDSVFTLALGGLTAQQIGETLKADLVLAGALRAFPSHIRLRVEMIRVVDGIQIWVEDLLVERSRIVGSESELVGRLQFRLNTGSTAGVGPVAQRASQSAAATDAVSPREEPDPQPAPHSSSGEIRHIAAGAAPELATGSLLLRRQAKELFLRGHHEWQTLERHRMQDGLRQLIRATELDPSLIAAKVDLAHLCMAQSFDGFMAPAIAAGLVHRTAESIPDLPRQAAAILPALACVNLHFDRNLAAALRACELSAHLPHDPWITRERTTFNLSRHRFHEAIGQLHDALDLDPFSPWLQDRLAWAYHLDGQAEKSLAEIERTLIRFPGHQGAALHASLILAFNGDAERAVPMAQELVRRQPSFDLANAAEAYALACAGRTADARAILERLQWLSRERYVLRSFIPAVYVALGDLDAALAELRMANKVRCPWFFQMLADPRLKPLHGHPEFEQLRAILEGLELASGQRNSSSARPGQRPRPSPNKP
ncbi:MAG: winged helix-turn-helix domain-containing protein [Terracidiphilus sp.]|nr:winged helix-turn-helix domain-containing protein [Terracidiphilus sp.]